MNEELLTVRYLGEISKSDYAKKVQVSLYMQVFGASLTLVPSKGGVRSMVWSGVGAGGGSRGLGINSTHSTVHKYT